MNAHRRYFIAIALLTSALDAEEVPPVQMLLEGIRSNVGVFTEVRLPDDGGAVDFEIPLGADKLVLSNDEEFDGLRFTAPEALREKDFIWYFNAPETWSSWYICPLDSAFKPGFSHWIDADKLYKSFDRLDEPGRYRVFQSLDGQYFSPGESYVLWFRNAGNSAGGSLRGRLGFAQAGEGDSRSLEDIEGALELIPQETAVQVEHLNSRGGRIMLDPELFTAEEAEERVDDVFFCLRRHRRLEGGFFISMEMSVPPCESEPRYSKILERFGEADFVRTSEEIDRVALHAVDPDDRPGTDNFDTPDDPRTITYHYDYFGFQVASEDPMGPVIAVVTHAENYASLRSDRFEQNFAQIPTKNLTVFRSNSKEVGRIYFFLEGPKVPLVVRDPPPGSYRSANKALDYFGDGRWKLTEFHAGGKIAREKPFADHRLEGEATGYHPTGGLRYLVRYLDGDHHGEAIEYSESGEILHRWEFKHGEVVE